MSVSVLVNGEQRQLTGGATVETLMRSLAGVPAGGGIAVAVEGEIVRRTDWPTTELAEGAHVEVVVAVQGG
jgi:sulfur carrier protein